MPSDWILPGEHPLVAAYSRCAARHDALAAELRTLSGRQLSEEERARRDRLGVELRAEAGMLINLARSLRLTPHSRHGSRSAARVLDAFNPNVARLWERSGEAEDEIEEELGEWSSPPT
jgi:hypothetical protein